MRLMNFDKSFGTGIQPGKRTRVVMSALLLSWAVLGPVFARADSTFDVSGAFSQSLKTTGPGTFTGTLAVNTATGFGRLDGVDITFQRDPFPFNSLNNSSPSGANWQFVAFNSNNEGLYLTFSTSPTAGSLVGLTGSTIVSGVVLNLVGGTFPVYTGFSGSITPAVSVSPSPVPEPAPAVLLALGLVAWLWFEFSQKRAMKRNLEA